jgi:hypothetical protein
MKDAMQVARASPPRPNLVIVALSDTALLVEMPASATMGELADYHADPSEAHGGKPVAVDVHLVC